jgi:hypothetical protein
MAHTIAVTTVLIIAAKIDNGAIPSVDGEGRKQKLETGN